MIIQKINNGRWILKKKFTFAAATLLVGIIIAFKGMHLADDPEGLKTVLGSFSTFASWLLGLIFAADVGDKFLNGGKYNDKGETDG